LHGITSDRFLGTLGCLRGKGVGRVVLARTILRQHEIRNHEKHKAP